MSREAYPIEYHPDFRPFDKNFALIGRNQQIIIDADKTIELLKAKPRKEMLQIATETYLALEQHRSPDGKAENVMQFVYQKGVNMFEKILTSDELAEIQKKVEAPDQYGENIMRWGWV